MKKIVSLLLVVVMICALFVGCKDSGEQPANTNAPAANTESEDVAPSGSDAADSNVQLTCGPHS